MIQSIILEPFALEFMRLALLEVVLVGLVAGALGCYVVLRGLTFIGEALAHAVFPGVVIAFLIGQSTYAGAIVVAVLTTFGIGAISRTRQIREDAAIGIVLAGAFALGVVLLSGTRSYGRDLAAFLVGNVLATTPGEVAITGAIGLAIIGTVVAFHKELVLVSFDRGIAEAMGYPVFRLDILLLLLIAVTIVVALPAVGNVLVLALLVTPAATARLLTSRLPTMMGLSAGLAALEGAAGLLVSYHLEVATGGTIVLLATAVFAVVFGVSQARRRFRTQPI